MNKSTKEISQAVLCWNRLFEWTASKCTDESEGVKVLFLLNKILTAMRTHPNYYAVDSSAWTELYKEMKEYQLNNQS